MKLQHRGRRETFALESENYNTAEAEAGRIEEFVRVNGMEAGVARFKLGIVKQHCPQCGEQKVFELFRYGQCFDCDQAEKARLTKQHRDDLAFKEKRNAVVSLITSGTRLKRSDIPRALIEAKYAQIQLKQLWQHQRTLSN